MSIESSGRATKQFVTAIIGEQIFGFSIQSVQDVFSPGRITRVPLAPPEIAGVTNLRGRVVTLIDMPLRLGLRRHASRGPVMAIGLELRGEAYGLLIDRVGEVMTLDNEAFEPNPINLDPQLARISSGIYRLEKQLLIVADVERVLDISTMMAA